MHWEFFTVDGLRGAGGHLHEVGGGNPSRLSGALIKSQRAWIRGAANLIKRFQESTNSNERDAISLELKRVDDRCARPVNDRQLHRQTSKY